MAIEVDTITLPAAWASALINGDYSGLDFEDAAEAKRCADTEDELAAGGWSIVDCDGEARFTWSYDLYDRGASCRGGDVLDFTILRTKKD